MGLLLSKKHWLLWLIIIQLWILLVAEFIEAFKIVFVGRAALEIEILDILVILRLEKHELSLSLASTATIQIILLDFFRTLLFYKVSSRHNFGCIGFHKFDRRSSIVDRILVLISIVVHKFGRFLAHIKSFSLNLSAILS